MRSPRFFLRLPMVSHLPALNGRVRRMKAHRNAMIRTFSQLTAADESMSGAKAYNCARLKQAGFRVPDGVVVLSRATATDIDALREHPWFDALPHDELFAVRSSGIGED